jgi:hypothetical protein
MVCRGELLEEDALSCSACRDFAVGRRLHPGHAPPMTWTSSELQYAAFLTRLDELAQRHRVPTPVDPSEAPGAWAHFVLALDAYHRQQFDDARREARLARIMAPPTGWTNLAQHAKVLEAASHQASGGQDRSLPRRYRARHQIEFPSLPVDANFATAAWRHYELAVKCLRANDLDQAYGQIFLGLQAAGGPEAAGIEVAYLKQLGHAITRARKPRRRFDLHVAPSRPRDVQAVLNHFEIQATLPDSEGPGWATLAKAWIAIDHGAWQLAYAHIQETEYLAGFSVGEPLLMAHLGTARSRIPVTQRASNYAVKRHGRVRVPTFARHRQALER